MLKILLNGYQGRMGQAISSAAQSIDDCEIVASIGRDQSPNDDIQNCDIVIDFSVHQATPKLLQACETYNKPIVIGTTGFDQDTTQLIHKAAEKIPVVWAGNYSVGVNLLLHLTEMCSQILSSDFETEVVEMHHHNKVVPPSGTAQNILDAICNARNLSPQNIVHGRSGIIGARPNNEIGVHSLRGGSVVGDHTVIFAGDDERIELTHKAGDRKIFANGAIKAAQWLVNKKPGLYDMKDVLNLGNNIHPS